jgi:glycosyltransferase involved in cell wall biosynthesis
MSRLLIATDGPFYRQGNQVFDRYCFDRAFFDDYAAAFDEVRVAARVDHGTAVDGMHRADGGGVDFVDLEDVHGARWVLAPWWRYCRALAEAVDWADAVCARIPSVVGWHAARLARRCGKPVMFELIGDPIAAGAGSLPRRVGGLVQGRRTRWIARQSRLGSYVSRAHLQRRYPASADAATASISSIRLPPESFRPPRTAPIRSGHLHLVCVGVFLAVKNQPTLLEALAIGLRQGLSLSLTLVGDGPCRSAIERRIERLDIADRVSLTGHLVGRAKIEAELDAADLFVMPSRSEGMPRAAIEAMARGLPVVGSTAPGIRELLPEACCFDPADPQAIVAMVRRFAEPDMYREAAQACSARAVEFAHGRLSAKRRALLMQLRCLAQARKPWVAKPAMQAAPAPSVP